MNLSDVLKLIEPVKNRVLLMVGRAVINSVKDEKGRQSLKATFAGDVVRDDIERVQQYGFTSNPLSGGEAVVLFAGGNRDCGIVICTDDSRYRIKAMDPGEVAIYTDEGDKIHFKRGNIIEITAGTLKLGSDSSSNPVVLGTELSEFLGSLCDQIAQMTMIGNLGAPTSPPLNAAAITALKAQYVSSGLIKSDKVFTEK